MWFFSLLLLSLLPFVSAIFADEAGVIDWHYALLGKPRQDATFFHQPYAASKASLLYTLSERNVLGAINPKDGSLVWRQILSSNVNATAANLAAGENQDTILSSIDNTITAWSASDGRLAWSRTFERGHVKNLEVLELPKVEGAPLQKDAIVLLEGDTTTVLQINTHTGATVWRYEDKRSDSTCYQSFSHTNLFTVETCHIAFPPPAPRFSLSAYTKLCCKAIRSKLLLLILSLVR